MGGKYLSVLLVAFSRDASGVAIAPLPYSPLRSTLVGPSWSRVRYFSKARQAGVGTRDGSFNVFEDISR